MHLAFLFVVERPRFAMHGSCHRYRTQHDAASQVLRRMDSAEANEHLLLDMTCDWYHPVSDSASATTGAYMERPPGIFPHDFVCEPSLGQLHSELCDSHV